jgi:hypothetical protein
VNRDADPQTETAMARTDLHRRTVLQAALAALSGVGGLVASPARADPDDDGFRIGGRPGRRWRMVGEARARRSVDRDVVRVNADRAYSAIRLRVFHAPVEFLNVQIHFRNGGSREIEVRQIIERGGATRVIDLPGERRFIDRIVFWYKTPALASERARVQVWARA